MMLGFLRRAAAAVSGQGFATQLPVSTRAVPKRGTRDMLAAYSASPVLQAVARKIAFGVASIDWHALATLDGRQERVSGHIMANVLNRGVPGLDGLQCRLAMELHLLLVGETFAVLDRNALGAPVRRWPVPPHWVRETPLPGRPWFVVQPEGAGSIRYPADDVLWLKEVDPMRPYERGSGIGMSLDDELSADEQAAKHVASSLANRARPDIIVSGTQDAPFSGEAVDRLTEVWPQKFGGAGRAGLPLFSRGPVEVQTLTPTFAELQLTNLRAYERDIIVSVFGVPPELVGILANSNRATIESAEFLFTKHVLRPRLESQRAAYDDQLAPQYGDGLATDFDDPVDEDAEARRAYMTANRWAFSVDEHRDAAGHQPLPDGAGERFPMAFSDIFASHAPVAQPVARGKGLRTKSPEDAFRDVPEGWFAGTLEAAYRETVKDFAAQALADIGVEIAFDVFDPRVADWLSTMAAERSRLIVGTTREALKVTLAEGVAAGENSTKLRQRIQATVTDAGAVRANTIARTEIVQASNYATTEAHREAGIEQREWLATQDDRVRDEHMALDGRTVGIDEAFEIDGSRGMYPGGFGVAALDINCRCAVLPKISGIDAAKRKAAWLKIEGGRAGHERALEARLAADFAALADHVAAALED